ncbi:MAG: MinD/ParA family protein [Bdellovibrionaceae bacterium]|jgi:flagellar biosynthesis protein FlhG|nr:MinD/ParA family protein [Pseudobdellovibrionaceae bacterium]
MNNVKMYQPTPITSRRPTQSISITSGKGGVGKSTLVSNIAVRLAELGNRVLILDGDLGMANIDIMFDVKSKYSIYDVITGEKRMADVIVPLGDNISLIPGGSGVYGLQTLDMIQKWSLMEQINQLGGHYDYLLIDTAPGIDDKVLYLNAAAEDVSIVVTPDPSSITDSYALIKLMNQKYKKNKFSIICNMVQDEREALSTYERLSRVAQDFLCVRLDYLGFVPNDLNLRQSNIKQQLILKQPIETAAVQSIKKITEKLGAYEHHPELHGGLQFFWENLVGVA